MIRILFVTLALGFCYSGIGQVRKQWRNPNPSSVKWELLSPGLAFSLIDAPLQCNIGDSKIRVLRIDPQYFSFQLLSTKKLGHRNLTADHWGRQYHLAALVNAGMYQMDHQTNVGYMRSGTFINNGHISKDNTFLAFGPNSDSLPPIQIIDRKCQDWKSLMNQYEHVSQGIRMIDCGQQNRWSQQAKYWSMVIFAIDKKGRALMIHCRSPYSVHDMIDMLLELPLDIYNAMYLEGGPEASFFLKQGNKVVAEKGSYETGFYESDQNQVYWPIPNIIGVLPKKNK